MLQFNTYNFVLNYSLWTISWLWSYYMVVWIISWLWLHYMVVWAISWLWLYYLVEWTISWLWLYYKVVCESIVLGYFMWSMCITYTIGLYYKVVYVVRSCIRHCCCLFSVQNVYIFTKLQCRTCIMLLGTTVVVLLWPSMDAFCASWLCYNVAACSRNSKEWSTTRTTSCGLVTMLWIHWSGYLL